MTDEVFRKTSSITIHSKTVFADIFRNFIEINKLIIILGRIIGLISFQGCVDTW
jgi:hypothetical protein